MPTAPSTHPHPLIAREGRTFDARAWVQRSRAPDMHGPAAAEHTASAAIAVLTAR